jgi:hypothetical protein
MKKPAKFARALNPQAIRNSSLLFLCGCFRCRFLFCSGLIHELKVRHQGGIALTGTKLYDSAITALPCCSTRRQFSKQLPHRFLLAEKRKGHAAGVKVASFSERNHLFGIRTYSLCLSQSSSDSIVLDEAANLVCEQQISMLGLPTQLDRLLRVAHNSLQGYELRFLTPFSTHRRFDQSRFEFHSEAETELLQLLLNFVQ